VTAPAATRCWTFTLVRPSNEYYLFPDDTYLAKRKAVAEHRIGRNGNHYYMVTFTAHAEANHRILVGTGLDRIGELFGLSVPICALNIAAPKGRSTSNRKGATT